MRKVDGWTVETLEGDVGSLHHSATPSTRTVRLMRPTRAAIVLGSSQAESDVDAEFCRANDFDVVRRRSGGGAVFVHPTDTVWVDFVIPRGDPLWNDDVAAAMQWVGRVWLAALEGAGVGGLSVHVGPFASSDWSKTLCFAGVGTGEVFLGNRKMIGISQRRTREAARFQCSGHLVWQPEVVAGALPMVGSDRVRLERLVACLPKGFTAEEVLGVMPP